MQFENKDMLKHFSDLSKAIHMHIYNDMLNVDIHPGSFCLIHIIKSQPGITQKEISNKNMTKPSTVAEMLKKMEANNYVYREADDKDKRVMHVYLTEKGENIIDMCEQIYANVANKVFSNFSEEDKKKYYEIMKKFNV